jgi:hypothetical protein
LGAEESGVTHLFPGEEIWGEMKPGERVIWQRRAKGGYGYLQHIHCTVVSKTPSGRYSVRLELSGRVVTVARTNLAREGAAVRAGV